MKTIVFQGDSITDAGRSREDESNFGGWYASRVKDYLDFEYPCEYKMYNRGIGGNKIKDMYERVESDIIDLKPDFMSILIGVNDVWAQCEKEESSDAEQYYQIYCQIIEKVKEALPDIQIMILAPFALRGTGNEKYWEQFYAEILKYGEQAKRVAQKYNLFFVPLQDKFDEAAKRASCEYWLFDGVHPTYATNELLKREWINAFKQIINLKEG